MEVLRVAIVEDDVATTEYLCRRIERAEGMRVMGTFASGDDLLRSLSELKADVVLMDINMPGTSGVDCVREARLIRPDLQFLMLTVFMNPAYIFEALRAGATGYLLKSTPAEELIDAIRDLHRGGSPMSSAIARMVVNSFQQEAAQPIQDGLLSAREREVLDGLAAGLKYKEIAEKAGLSTETVRVHVRRIYSKLQVRGRMEAVRKVFPKNR
ncbi:MAG: response regulator transcription factor [Flavobacteriales bacterium]|nr:response regulator transcription factor [Flavobacteriales bacterium]MCB9163612.1 response regulator transcription factor [Flavobacteriales bacterium]